MRILWIVNMVFPKLASKLNISTGNSGTWMFDIADMLDKDEKVDFAIACVYGKEFRKIKIDNTIFYCLPGTGKDMMYYNPRLTEYWKMIVNDFTPDLVNIHGTEYCHAISFLRSFPSIKKVVSLQGMMSKIVNYDFAGLTFKDIILNRTIREWTHFNGMLEYHFFHKKNAKTEREMLLSVDNCMVVDAWHKSVAYEINPKLRFFEIHYNLRKEFYNSPKWCIDKIKKHKITTTPGGTALKGLHQLFKAVAIVKEKYPDVLVSVPGMLSNENGLVANTGYAKYLKRLINKLHIETNVQFLGAQTADQMLNNMLTSHIQVIPSSIEGPSLILHEGMHIGVPSIATFRGGMADFIDDKVNGFLYDFGEYQYLAIRIMEIFESDELALRLSKNAIKKTEEHHDREANHLAYLNMYNEILAHNG